MGNQQAKDPNAYWCDFHEKRSEANEDVSLTVNKFNHMIDDILKDYKFNKDDKRAIHLIEKLEKSVEEFFSSSSDRLFTSGELDILTNLCRKINENAELEGIRSIGLHERPYQENIKPHHFVFQDRLAGVKTKTNLEMSFPNKNIGSKLSKIASATNLRDHYKLKATLKDYKAKIPSLNRLKTVFALKYPKEIKEVNEFGSQMEIEEELSTERNTAQEFGVKKRLSNDEKAIAKQEINELIKKMKEEFDDHRIDFAYDLLVEFRQLTEKEHLDDWVADYINSRLEFKAVMDEIENNYKDLEKVTAEFDDEDGYSFEKIRENLSLKYKKYPKGKIGLKFEGVVDISLAEMLALLHEPDFYTHWAPYCTKAKLLKRIGTGSNIMSLKWDLPKPFSTRKTLVMSTVVNRMDINGSLLITSKTINEDTNLVSKYHLKSALSKSPMLGLELSGIELVPLSRKQTVLKFVAITDPKAKGMMASTIINWISRKAATEIFDKLEETARNNRHNSQKYIENDKEFYTWLHRLINQHLGSHSNLE